MKDKKQSADNKKSNKPAARKAMPEKHKDLPKEHGGRNGPDPTRYGDWEMNGKCVDF